MLFGKTIVVTGAASGIGARTAETAVALGADVIGVDVHVPAQPVGSFVHADLASQAGVEALVSKLPPRVDALCNVAGVSGAGGIVATLSINFYGLRALTEALAPRLREGGSVVNVASFAGFGWRANLDRARAMADAPGFPDIARLAAANGAGDEIGYRDHASAPARAARRWWGRKARRTLPYRCAHESRRGYARGNRYRRASRRGFTFRADRAVGRGREDEARHSRV